MNYIEFNELVARAVSRGMKEGVNEKKMDPLQMIGALEFQKQAIIAQMIVQSKPVQESPIVAATRLPSGN